MPDLSCGIFKPASYCTGDAVFGPPALLFIQFPFEDTEPFPRERGKKLIRLTGRKIFPLRMIAGKGIRMKPFPLYSKPEQSPLPGCRRRIRRDLYLGLSVFLFFFLLMGFLIPFSLFLLHLRLFFPAHIHLRSITTGSMTEPGVRFAPSTG